MIPIYVKKNVHIPPTEEELELLNKLIMPQTFDGFTDFNGNRQYSIIFYSQFDSLIDLFSDVGADVETDLLRRIMRFLPIEPSVMEMDKNQLLEILFGRILFEYYSTEF